MSGTWLTKPPPDERIDQRVNINISTNMLVMDKMSTEQAEAFYSKLHGYSRTGLTSVQAFWGGGGLPEGYVYCIWTWATGNPMHMGIDPEGRCST